MPELPQDDIWHLDSAYFDDSVRRLQCHGRSEAIKICHSRLSLVGQCMLESTDASYLPYQRTPHNYFKKSLDKKLGV